MVFGFVWTIVFHTLYSLDSVRKDSVSLLLAIIILGYYWVHVHPSNYSNIFSNIEASIDKALSFTPTLNVLNVYLDNGHI